jgi:hypothetical protein
VPRVDEGAQADAAEVSGLARGDVAEQVRDDTLRQVVGLDEVLDRQLLQLGHQAPMAADGAPDEPGVAQVVQAARLAVALAARVQQREAGGLVRGGNVLVEVQRLQRDRHAFRKADADKAAGGHRVARADQAHRVGGGDDLAAPAVDQRGDRVA